MAVARHLVEREAALPDKPAFIISDEPKRDAPQFGFEEYAKTIADLIAFKENKTPLVIGIYGPWGSGKTTLMQTVAHRLAQYERNKTFRACKPVWFQAWKYAGEDAILAALIEEIFKAMQEDKFFEQCKASLETLAAGLKGKKIVGELSKLLSGGSFDITEFFARLDYKDKLGFFPAFQEFFDRLVATYVSRTGVAGFASVKEVDDSSGVLVIFIDDLDRCPKPRVLKILETVKLFMDKKGCVFVIGAAREVIESAIRESYKEKGEAEKFMEKIVQVTFTLPQIREDDACGFITTFDDQSKMLKEHAPLVARTLNYNPRAVKRFLNNLSLTQSLAENLKLDAPPDALLRWTIVEYVYPGLAKLMKENPVYVRVMKEKIGELAMKEGYEERTLQITEALAQELKIPTPLTEFLRDQKAVELVEGLPDDPKLIERLVSLSATASGPEGALTKEPLGRGAASAFDKMAKVPKGDFLYGDQKESVTIDHDYEIDIYPVTNEQYRRFIDSGGYTNRECWSEDGWRWREAGKVVQPDHWDNPKWTQPDHPVVGVSWYEAEAYAKWAGKRLSTEQEWEKAARGTDGRIYPWGDEFDKEKCNSAESGIEGTSSVTKYVNGLSPYGCYDMAGNVWEWTSSQEGAARVLRGGSWYSIAYSVRSANRNYSPPSNRDANVGFRCAKTP